MSLFKEDLDLQVPGQKQAHTKHPVTDITGCLK